MTSTPCQAVDVDSEVSIEVHFALRLLVGAPTVISGVTVTVRCSGVDGGMGLRTSTTCGSPIEETLNAPRSHPTVIHTICGHGRAHVSADFLCHEFLLKLGVNFNQG